MADAPEKIAVIYDQKTDDYRVGETTKALQDIGYKVQYFDETQGVEMLRYITQEKPALVVTSSMSSENIPGALTVRQASEAGIPAVMYSWHSGFGMEPSEVMWFKKLTSPAGFYQYEEYSDFKPEAFMAVVQDTLAKAGASAGNKGGEATRASAIDPTTVDASRPKEWGKTAEGN